MSEAIDDKQHPTARFNGPLGSLARANVSTHESMREKMISEAWVYCFDGKIRRFVSDGKDECLYYEGRKYKYILWPEPELRGFITMTAVDGEFVLADSRYQPVRIATRTPSRHWDWRSSGSLTSDRCHLERIEDLQKQIEKLRQSAQDVLDDHFWPPSVNDSRSVELLRDTIDEDRVSESKEEVSSNE